MGRKSREKKLRRENGENANKMMNDVRKRSKVIAVEKVINGKTVVQYFNPTKRLMQMREYKDSDGMEALNTMVNRYSKYLNANGVNLEEKKENEL